MPDDPYDDNDEVDNDNDEQVSLSRAEHDDLRAKARKAKKADEALTVAQAAQRELAFVKAGVDTDSPIGKLLLAGYTGELTPEAIKAEAVSVGAIEAPVEENKGPEVTTEEAASTEERSTLASGAEVGTITDPDPRATAVRIGEQALAAGAQEAVASGLTFRELASNEKNWERVS